MLPPLHHPVLLVTRRAGSARKACNVIQELVLAAGVELKVLSEDVDVVPNHMTGSQVWVTYNCPPACICEGLDEWVR